jgi:hypothetical protein
MNAPLRIEVPVHFQRRRWGGKQLQPGLLPAPSQPRGGVPRVARLLALALRMEELIGTGQIASYSALASLGHVTPARVCQIMNLLYLAPDIQEQVLFLPRTECGRDPIILADLQPIAAVPDWGKQRRLWRQLILALPGGPERSAAP